MDEIAPHAHFLQDLKARNKQGHPFCALFLSARSTSLNQQKPDEIRKAYNAGARRPNSGCSPAACQPTSFWQPQCPRANLVEVRGPVIKDLIDWSFCRSTQERSLQAAEPRPCASDGAKYLRASHFAAAHIANQPLAGSPLSGCRTRVEAERRTPVYSKGCNG